MRQAVFYFRSMVMEEQPVFLLLAKFDIAMTTLNQSLPEDMAGLPRLNKGYNVKHFQNISCITLVIFILQ